MSNSKSMDYINRLRKTVIVDPYPFVIDLEKSKGMWLQSIDGDRFFDWTGMYGSRLLGYNHDKLQDPIYQQKLLKVANNKMANPDYLTPECVHYYELAYSLAPKIFKPYPYEIYVVNSGAEAVENMMKYLINIYHSKDIRRTSKQTKRFLYFDQSFHGRTISTLNITNLASDKIATRDFHGLMPHNKKLPFPAYNSALTEQENLYLVDLAINEIEEEFSRYQEEIVGVILEILQGAGGQRIAHKSFYSRLAKLCFEYDILWGIDEVQTAGGQTGEIFSVDLLDLPHPPNAVVTAKKFGNGILYMRESMQDEGILDSTWGGSLVDMVRFKKEWSIVQEDNLLQMVSAKSNHMIERLNMFIEKYDDHLTNPRGLGLYQGFSFLNQPLKSKFIDHAFQKHNLLLLGAGRDSIRFRPPLDVSHEEIDLLFETLNVAMQNTLKNKL